MRITKWGLRGYEKEYCGMAVWHCDSIVSGQWNTVMQQMTALIAHWRICMGQ